GVDWIGERVAVPQIDRIRRNLEEERDDVSWGPNNCFRYPRRGGTGAIWTAVASLLDSDRLRFAARVIRVDLERRTVSTADGEVIAFDHLISSLPLDTVVRISTGMSADATRAAAAML